VRAFQPPGAPTRFSLKPTGKGNEVQFDFGAASGNGVKESEITYRWSAGGHSGTVKPGTTVVTSSAFQLGQSVTVRLVAVANVLGQTSEGEAATATVTAYGPPQAPVVSSEGGVEQASLRWQVPGSSNGARVKQVEITTTVKAEGKDAKTDTWTTDDLSGSVDKGDGRKQNVCVKARAQNEHGVWSEYSSESCASTWGDKKATLTRDDSYNCQGQGWGCLKVTVQNWEPGETTCKLPSPRRHDDDEKIKIRVRRIDPSGNGASDPFPADLLSEGYGDGKDVTGECK